MRSTAKNRKQRSTYLPISIKFLVKAVLVGMGLYVWGTGFVWALVALYLFLPILRAVLSLIVGVAAIIAFLFILLTFL